jgi:tetratricopeptide (TPR) repeat protein
VSRRRARWAGPLALALIAAAVAFAYGNGLHGPFLMDDGDSIVANASIRPPWRIGRILSPPTTGSPVHGRPLANLSFAINYALGGTSIGGYHLFNVALHLLNCWLLFGIVRATLERLQRGDAAAAAVPSPLRGAGLALAAALLWAVHPLTTSAVNYLSQRTELLVALFYLLTLYCTARSATATTAARRWTWDVATVLACLLGALSKEVIVTAPLLAALYDRAFVFDSWGQAFRRRGWTYAGLAATWVPLAWLVAGGGSRAGTAGFGGRIGVWDNLLTQCQALTIYLERSLWPRALVFDYGWGVVRRARDVAPQIVLVAALLTGTAALVRWRPRLGFLAAAWFVILAPTSSVVPILTQTIGEHRAYLPLAALLVAAVVVLERGARRVWQGSRGAGEIPAAGPSFVVLALLALPIACAAMATRQRNRTFGSAVEIWEDSLSHWPWSARAYNNVGTLRYVASHDFERAVDYYTRAIRLDAKYASAYVNRAGALFQLGRTQEAFSDCQRGLALDAKQPQAYEARSSAYVTMGQPYEALADCDEAIRLQPDDAVAFNNRAAAYLMLGLPDRAIADTEQAMRLRPGFAEAYYNRGNAYNALGRFELAVADYDAALRLDRDFAVAYNNRGTARASLGRHREAIEDYNQAMRCQPLLAVAYLNRARCHAALGEFAQASADVRRCQELGGTVDAAMVALIANGLSAAAATQPGGRGP